MLEIIVESCGAPCRRSGANAMRSRRIPKSPVATNANTIATYQGRPRVAIAKSATNAPSMKTVGWARFRMSRTLNTSAKPTAKSA